MYLCPAEYSTERSYFVHLYPIVSFVFLNFESLAIHSLIHSLMF